MPKHSEQGQHSTLAILEHYAENQGDAWRYTEPIAPEDIVDWVNTVRHAMELMFERLREQWTHVLTDETVRSQP